MDSRVKPGNDGEQTDMRAGGSPRRMAAKISRLARGVAGLLFRRRLNLEIVAASKQRARKAEPMTFAFPIRQASEPRHFAAVFIAAVALLLLLPARAPAE